MWGDDIAGDKGFKGMRDCHGATSKYELATEATGMSGEGIYMGEEMEGGQCR